MATLLSPKARKKAAKGSKKKQPPAPEISEPWKRVGRGQPPTESDDVASIEDALAKRTQAKAVKNYVLADKLAAKLQKQGVCYDDKTKEWHLKRPKEKASNPQKTTFADGADEDESSSDEEEDSEEERLDDDFVAKMQKRIDDHVAAYSKKEERKSDGDASSDKKSKKKKRKSEDDAPSDKKPKKKKKSKQESS